MSTACCARALPRWMSRRGLHVLLTLQVGMPISNTRNQCNRSVKRCRLVKDWSRLWTEGVRDVVMAIGCARHIVRVRLTPSQPMIASGYTPWCLPGTGYRMAGSGIIMERRSRWVGSRPRGLRW